MNTRKTIVTITLEITGSDYAKATDKDLESLSLELEDIATRLDWASMMPRGIADKFKSLAARTD